MQNFHGIIPACVTPFVDDRVDPAAMQSNIEQWLGTGVHGFLISGSTGEFAYVEDDERGPILRAARSSTPDDRLLLAGCGAESTRRTLGYVHEAADYGADAALVVTPVYYTRGKTEAQRTYYLTVADASPIPVLIYNVPLFTQYELPVELVVELSQHPNIAGIKDSSSNPLRVPTEINETVDSFAVFSGNPNMAFPALASGAVGGIYAFANIAPEIYVAIYEAVQAGDLRRAASMQFAINNLSAAIGSLGIPAIKAILNHRGFSAGDPRAPLHPLASETRTQVIDAWQSCMAVLDKA